MNSFFYNEMKKIPRLTEREFSELLKLGTKEAKDKIWKASLRLVFTAVRSYKKKLKGKCTITEDDLVSVAAIKVLRAIETYDPEKGKFVAWVYLHVTSGLQTEMFHHQRIVRYPWGAKEQYIRYDISECKDIPEQPPKNGSILPVLKEFGKNLSRKQMAAVTMYYNNGLEDGETAQEWGCSKQNVYGLRTEGIRKLKMQKKAIEKFIG